MFTSRDVKAAISSTAFASASTKKEERTTVDNFLLLWVCSLPSPAFQHFEEKKTYAYIAITLFTSLKLIFPNYSVFVFS